jgi:hypothetical protein
MDSLESAFISISDFLIVTKKVSFRCLAWQATFVIGHLISPRIASSDFLSIPPVALSREDVAPNSHGAKSSRRIQKGYPIINFLNSSGKFGMMCGWRICNWERSCQGVSPMSEDCLAVHGTSTM